MRNSGGRVVVVTGASAGVGRAAARAFASEGDHVALLAREPNRLEAAARELQALGARAVALPTDVADPDQVERAADQVEAQLGPIDVWVNDAMVAVFSRVWDTRPEEFRRVIEVLYLGMVHGTLSALRRMRPRNRGTIVQVGSALAYRSIPLQSAYCAAKHAMVGFTDSLRCELLHEGSQVRVTAVHLPALNTPQFDWGRNHMSRKPQPVPPIFQPEVAARAIAWVSRHPRRELRVGFSTWKAIVGQKVAPGLLDRYLARRGFEGQLTDEPADPERPDNLWQPVRGDPGARGRFTDRAAGHSAHLWTTLHRSALAATALAFAGVVAFGAWAWRRT